MVAALPTLTATFDPNTGLVTTELDAVNQQHYKISFTRQGDTEPSYGTERWKGQFASTRDPQAHLIYNSAEDELVWNGEGVTSGRICNGTYRVAAYFINTMNERSPTATTSVTVSGVPCSDTGEDPDDRVQGELPAPTITQPTADATINAQNVVLAWTRPAGQVQAEYKAAVYREVDCSPTGVPLPGVQAIAGTIRTETQRDDSNRAHWAVGTDDRITFSDTSRNANQAITNGTYWARVRYRNAQRVRSEAAAVKFTVTGVAPDPPDPTPQEPGAPAITPGSGGRISLVSPVRIDSDQNYLLQWSVVFESGLPQESVKIERIISGDSLGRFYWTGETTGNTFTSTDTTVDQAAQSALLIAGPGTGAIDMASAQRYFMNSPRGSVCLLRSTSLPLTRAAIQCRNCSRWKRTEKYPPRPSTTSKPQAANIPGPVSASVMTPTIGFRT